MESLGEPFQVVASDTGPSAKSSYTHSAPGVLRALGTFFADGIHRASISFSLLVPHMLASGR